MHFSTLLFLAASSISTIYAQEVVVEGTKLINWDSCDSGQQKVIKEAWVDAIKLAEGAKNIQWNSAAALQFLGPQAYNKEDQPKIQGILNNVATFDPAWWFNPLAVGVFFHMPIT